MLRECLNPLPKDKEVPCRTASPTLTLGLSGLGTSSLPFTLTLHRHPSFLSSSPSMLGVYFQNLRILPKSLTFTLWN